MLRPLRYVLKNRATGEVLFVIQFALVPREEAEIEFNEKPQRDELGKGRGEAGNGEMEARPKAGVDEDVD